ncbi:MAG: hypothetical protein QGG19_17590 [Alphaproteobacteria bacterium]|jgi:hypothetical protein|nr:hypothetical protein [Rhodospirillaceae bacterium]MDP6023089.1 hypothetical protein [Alphaproteobacteria bacterium]MDP6256106.1 hypothetical protein [Alphaproteobacteria bacterium]MDP7054640.1 hypothetical protein [Alphaproteobacteria bacterium]MDP7228600.1 hypothetical protein [Alphaproteobacteria bacterium]|tara:strand:+ start:895 stop:1095 length:201 start_codon:yes stop_codon:yes gene_type:complete
MFFTSDLTPGEMHVARALISGEIDRAPQAHAFHDQRAHWVDIPDGLAHYDSTEPKVERYKATKALD